MEFWGVEVKAGQPLKVKPEEGSIIHISQAALGEVKKEKGNDSVHLHLKINGEKLVVGTLSAEKFPQITFDLVFEKEFELSHEWKNGSVYFCGYSTDNAFGDDEDDFGSEESDDEEDIPLSIANNGKIEPKVEEAKLVAGKGEAKLVAGKGKAAKPESSAEPKKATAEPKEEDESDEDDESDDDDEEDGSDEFGDDKEMMDASDDSDDSEDEDEETPKKAAQNKKRPNESATKTPISSKKAKLETPQKTDGKKGGSHTATPHPKKQAGKTPVSNSNKSKEQTPKSDGKVSCKSCSKTFNSESALQSHSKDKHGGK
ncbi:Histone deacetylase [Bertholletia excelsa]